MATATKDAAEFVVFLRRLAERVESEDWGVRWLTYDLANDIGEGEPVRDEHGDLWATNHSTGHQHIQIAVELEKPGAESASEEWETLEQPTYESPRGTHFFVREWADGFMR